ncbi:hypothetical protein O9929_23585 [Vibrio lentus]|nr:hypothetical protein [Vibrio lentus]
MFLLMLTLISKRLKETLLELAETHDYFVIAGSLPQGVSPELCASWVQLA